MTSDLLGRLPTGWTQTSVRDIVEDVTKVDPRAEPDKAFVYLDISSVDSATKSIVAPKRYLGRDAPSRARQLVAAGDTLFSTVRTYLRKIAMVSKAYDGQVASTGFCVIRPVPAVDSRFVFLLVQTDSIVNALTQVQRGTSYPAVRDSDVLAQNVLLPPLPEQRRIVAKIEELFTRLDAGVEALERVQALLKRYRQAVLKAAFEGKLTAAWREAHRDELEPAAALLERLRREREAAAPRKRSRRVPPLDTSGLPELPEGWEWARLGTCLVHLTKGESPGWQGFEYASEGVPFIRSENVRWGTLDMSSAPRIPRVFHRKLSRSQIQPGDVLVNLVGASIGRCALVPSSVTEANVNQAVALLRTNEALVPGYLAQLILAPTIQGFINQSKVETARPNVSLTDLRELVIPLPPTAEQHRIGEELDRRLSVVDDIAEAVQHAASRSRRLRQSILRRAFEGKLVPQDPTDEPAERLLERIRAERGEQRRLL